MGGQRRIFKPRVLSGYSRGAIGPRKRKKRPSRRKPPLTVKQILAWADAHRQRTGQWPQILSGPVPWSRGETWQGIDTALRQGYRGLPGGSSLAKLLAEHRGARNKRGLPRLTVEQILAWADAHHERTGSWPQTTSGPIPEAPGETWWAVNCALNSGWRGLSAGLSLNAVLARHRGVPKQIRAGTLTIEQILKWAEEYRQQMGRWPNVESGRVNGGSGPTWRAIDLALRRGENCLRGGSSLHRLLMERRGLKKRQLAPCLSVEQILAWARAHRQRTGQWPTGRLGAVHGVPGKNWHAIDAALSLGHRGLPGGTTLRQLLTNHGGT